MAKAGKPKPKTKKKPDKGQAERFIETARRLSVDESDEAFELAFQKIVPPKLPPK